MALSHRAAHPGGSVTYSPYTDAVLMSQGGQVVEGLESGQADNGPGVVSKPSELTPAASCRLLEDHLQHWQVSACAAHSSVASGESATMGAWLARN